MTKRAPLDALIRRVSRMAEQMFDRHGDIDPIWLVETASGEQHTIVSPIIAPSPLAAAAEKDRIAAEMRNYFAENDVVRYACAKEAWTLADPERKQMPTTEQAALEYAAMGYTLANHPERREVVTIDAEDGTKFLTALRDIIRPAHGKPYLGKLGPIERFDGIVTSRWTGLLPSKEHAAALRERPSAEEPRRVRFSSELVDDVGRVFVTAVPNAPIQLTGRRDPATDELCVGAVVGGPKHAPWPPPDTPNWIEVVTGSEAELLILSVHRWLTERAEAAGLTFDEYAAKHFKREQEPKP
jgi:hypothetical protein